MHTKLTQERSSLSQDRSLENSGCHQTFSEERQPQDTFDSRSKSSALCPSFHLGASFSLASEVSNHSPTTRQFGKSTRNSKKEG